MVIVSFTTPHVLKPFLGYIMDRKMIDIDKMPAGREMDALVAEKVMNESLGCRDYEKPIGLCRDCGLVFNTAGSIMVGSQPGKTPIGGGRAARIRNAESIHA